MKSSWWTALIMRDASLRQRPLLRDRRSMAVLVREKSACAIGFNAHKTSMDLTVTFVVFQRIDSRVILMETWCVKRATRMQQMGAQIVYQTLPVVSNSSISFTVKIC